MSLLSDRQLVSRSTRPAQDEINEFDRYGVAGLADDDEGPVLAKDVRAELIAGNGIGRDDRRVDARHALAKLVLDRPDGVGRWLLGVDDEVGRELETAGELERVGFDVDTHEAQPEHLRHRNAKVAESAETADRVSMAARDGRTRSQADRPWGEQRAGWH